MKPEKWEKVLMGVGREGRERARPCGMLLGRGEPGWNKSGQIIWSLGYCSREGSRVSDELLPHWAFSGKTAALKGFPVWMVLSESLRNSRLGELRWLAGTPNRPDTCHAVLTQGSDWS